MHGLPSVFLTYTPDDINSVLNLRLTLSQTGNDSFPADGDGFAEAISDQKNKFHGIKISPHHLRVLLAKGSLAAAEIFRLLKLYLPFCLLHGLITPQKERSRCQIDGQEFLACRSLPF
jgi:hypothetical protein